MTAEEMEDAEALAEMLFDLQRQYAKALAVVEAARAFSNCDCEPDECAMGVRRSHCRYRALGVALAAFDEVGS